MLYNVNKYYIIHNYFHIIWMKSKQTKTGCIWIFKNYCSCEWRLYQDFCAMVPSSFVPLVFPGCLVIVTPPVCSCGECLSCVGWFFNFFLFLRKVTFGTWWKFPLVDWAVLYWERLTFSFLRQLFTKLSSWSCVVRPCQELQAREPV